MFSYEYIGLLNCFLVKKEIRTWKEFAFWNICAHPKTHWYEINITKGFVIHTQDVFKHFFAVSNHWHTYIHLLTKRMCSFDNKKCKNIVFQMFTKIIILSLVVWFHILVTIIKLKYEYQRILLVDLINLMKLWYSTEFSFLS